jgi:phospholipid/cholesterol/gamma-HCH transport system ATP-binding protein
MSTIDLIKVTNFTKMFAQKKVHNDVTFSVHKGECLGLLGGSGAGKSVILRSLIGLEKPDSGKIFFKGEETTHLSENDYNAVRKEIAYVFQYGALFDSMTVFENLAYPLEEHSKLSPTEIKKAVTSLLGEFNLEGTENLYPSELSGGMQKRVGVARAIIMNPTVVLYDEPTAGLDPANTITIQDLILNLKAKGTTSILVTHDMDTALRVCDRVCLLKNGEITDLGPTDEIRKNKEKFINLFLGDKV